MTYKKGPKKGQTVKKGDSRLKYTPITCEEYLAKLEEDTAGQQTLQ